MTIQQLGSFLNHTSTRSGSFISRIAAARQFGLVESNDRFIAPTRLATKIIAPERPGVDDAHARTEAFLNIPLYRSLYERYKSGPLPPEMGLRNALETHYNVPRARSQVAYRVFMDSAEQAGFFQARAGARTHLVMPVIRPAEGEELFEPEEPTRDQETIRDQPPAPIELSTESDLIKRLRQILVEKIREVPATDLETIREYIKQIKELGHETESQEQE